MQPQWLGECNDVVICIKERCLFHHRVFEAIWNGLIFRHDPILVTENHVYYNIEDLGGHWPPLGDTPKPLEGIPVLSTCRFYHFYQYQ